MMMDAWNSMVEFRCLLLWLWPRQGPSCHHPLAKVLFYATESFVLVSFFLVVIVLKTMTVCFVTWMVYFALSSSEFRFDHCLNLFFQNNLFKIWVYLFWSYKWISFLFVVFVTDTVRISFFFLVLKYFLFFWLWIIEKEKKKRKEKKLNWFTIKCNIQFNFS